MILRLAWVSLLAAAVGACAGDESAQERDMKDRRLRWQQLGISDYTMRFIWHSESIQSGDTLLVEVRGDSVRSAEVVGPRFRGPGFPPASLIIPPGVVLTINQMFAVLERAFEEAGSVNLEYDDQFHYPRLIDIDWESRFVDDEEGYRVVSFERIR
jgi:hypothetical protein